MASKGQLILHVIQLKSFSWLKLRKGNFTTKNRVNCESIKSRKVQVFKKKGKMKIERKIEIRGRICQKISNEKVV